MAYSFEKYYRELRQHLGLYEKTLYFTTLPGDLHCDLVKYLVNDINAINIKLMSCWNALVIKIENHVCSLRLDMVPYFLEWLVSPVIVPFTWRGSYDNSLNLNGTYEFYKLHNWSGELIGKLRIIVKHNKNEKWMTDTTYIRMLLFMYKLQLISQ